MGTRLYITFINEEAEAEFFGSTVEEIKKTRSLVDPWRNMEPHQHSLGWGMWYKSLGDLGHRLLDWDMFGLGKVHFDPSKYVPDTKYYAGCTEDKVKIMKVLADHFFTCRQDNHNYVKKAMELCEKIQSISWS